MLAIIPARIGSKRIPKKNIKIFCGKPLIYWTILEAKKSKYISRIIVSTDDKYISKIAKDYGAEVPFLRPKHLSTDEASSIDVFKFTIKKLENLENITINSFIVLQPTSPLRTYQDIDNSIDLFINKNADSVISLCEEKHPIYWHKLLDEKGKIVPIFSPEEEIKIKNLKKTYYPNGAIYIFKRDVVFSNKCYTDNTYGYIMPVERSIDIDTHLDFELAEYLIKKYKLYNCDKK